MNRRRITVAILAVLTLLLPVGMAWAGSSAGLAINWWVLSSGGAPASSGTVSLNATLGQTAIGPASSAHNLVRSGFWVGQTRGTHLYLPIISRWVAAVPLDLVVTELAGGPE
jgi:hypothetical protein